MKTPLDSLESKTHYENGWLIAQGLYTAFMNGRSSVELNKK